MLAGAAGVAEATIYTHFETKERLSGRPSKTTSTRDSACWMRGRPPQYTKAKSPRLRRESSRESDRQPRLRCRGEIGTSTIEHCPIKSLAHADDRKDE
jgi:hypothetical protein